MLKVVLCEDNEKALDILKQWVEKIIHDEQYQYVEICKTSTRPSEILEYIDTQRDQKDLFAFFLDIDLRNQINGIMLAEYIKEHLSESKIVFITAHSHLGMEVINKHIEPFAYLTKPLKLEVFKIHFDSLYQTYQRYNETNKNITIMLSAFGKSQIAELDHIVYIETDPEKEGYIIVHEISGRYYHKSTLSRFLEEISQKRDSFIQVYKSYIVNTKYITKFDRYHKIIELGDVQLQTSRDKKVQELIEKMMERDISIW